MAAVDFEEMVERYYGPLHRFALSLARDSHEAGDLTQQTFVAWAEKGHQLRDPSKVKSWLFSTLYRQFLGARRRENRFPERELEACALTGDLPVIPPAMEASLDGATVLNALRHVDEVFRAPLSLFYLHDHSYKEIAAILDIPIGTVMSRIARGKEALRARLLPAAQSPSPSPSQSEALS
ncbi:RNA polymerase sigma-70 factor, ECF subfamily [Verrucomicrobium sp. GAS474]|uniref:RNA polymerase sigma factor n=1 Tax=Verrucomicrobium sp. GAS474 TaxID=1882831 RepID=UPI00087BD924|nr:RNA polymerase sigma factor [Verrucomicrobium sp. GAS474]SDT87217.1 RNA polymerase sigma-70 factor, ECF subfamily [Verrucomicrobium sp. GAS474]